MSKARGKGSLFKRTLNTRYFGRKTSFYEGIPGLGGHTNEHKVQTKAQPGMVYMPKVQESNKIEAQ
jgi:hypothetical protein